jgi:hypothetical protein
MPCGIGITADLGSESAVQRGPGFRGYFPEGLYRVEFDVVTNRLQLQA